MDIVLLGDDSRDMLSYLARRAAQAIKGGATLAEVLKTEAELATYTSFKGLLIKKKKKS